MILLIDIGNARIKWGLTEGDKVEYGSAFFYKDQPIDSLLAAHFKHLEYKRVVVSNVGGKSYRISLAEWFQKEKGIEAEFLFAESSALGLKIAYTEAKSFGMDRFFSMLSCWDEFSSPFVLLGCGSATTFDAVDATGQHRGSLIAPGLYLQHAAMAQLANCAVPADLAVPQFAYGKSTAEAISQGTISLIADFFNARYKTVCEELKAPVQCIITGGDAELIQPFLKMTVHYRPYCVLTGLARYIRS